ncbi:MAG TPA: hypothetical protein DCQ37_18100 [Desulfobacteraceae bacterium]|nr:hypothetical protein [Desulfobacteraceae bacterium]
MTRKFQQSGLHTGKTAETDAGSQQAGLSENGTGGLMNSRSAGTAGRKPDCPAIYFLISPRAL